ncbi:hypothetical protein O9993_05715 [Vibrio lentus]|nr:hypothetical protein [Vibrio lentus]
MEVGRAMLLPPTELEANQVPAILSNGLRLTNLFIREKILTSDLRDGAGGRSPKFIKLN